MAERAAWDFVAEDGGGLELSVINPVAVFGPALGSDLSTSVGMIKSMLNGEMPGCPRIYLAMVDVRDVVDLHIRAMTHPQAKGERFIAAAGDCMSMYEVSQVLKTHMPAYAKSLPRFQLPDWLVRLIALAEPRVKEAIPHLGVIRNASSAKAKAMLDWATALKQRSHPCQR